MKNLILKRIVAYFIDYLVIVVYALILFGITTMIYQLMGKSLEPMHPLKGNMVSLLTLTIPVFLYFFFTEKSKHQGTIGKRIMKIKVVANKSKSIFIRNVFKIIPWELAHIGIHWMVYYEEQGLGLPTWVWILMVGPQLLVLFYFITVIINKGESSFYDHVANTRIIYKTT
ncbi:MAG: hypothetical protein Tsb0033_26950 [Winogradskyella sp.]